MRVCILATVIVGLCAPPLHAVRIWGELRAVEGTPKAIWTLHGPNFSIRTEQDIFFTPPGPFLSNCALTSGGCAPGDPVFMSGGLSGSDVGPNSGTIEGVFYPNLLLTSGHTLVGTTLIYRAPMPTVTDKLVYTVPVSLSGSLAAYLGLETCVLCESIGDPNNPNSPGDMPLHVTGTGFATLTLAPNPDYPSFPDSGPLIVDNVVYRFEIPEPSTFVLACTALTAYGIARVLKRRRHAAR